MADKKKVKVNIPRIRKDEPDVFVCVNGKGILIKRGVEVEIPAEYAEVLKHSQKADNLAYEYMLQLEKQAEEKEAI